MKELFTIDLKDYDGCTEVFRRPSARGIILTDIEGTFKQFKLELKFKLKSSKATI